MAVTATPVFVQAPKLWSASINNGDSTAWKVFRDASGNSAGSNGAKISGITVTSTDSSARNVQIAVARPLTTTSFTGANPGVVTLTTGYNLANGDQVFFYGATMPTNITSGTTYFVVTAGTPSTSTGLTTTFQAATTFGGSAINTSSTAGVSIVTYLLRIVTTIPVAITAGTDGATASAYFFNTTYNPGEPVDNDGQPYLFLESGDFLVAAPTAQITSAKIINLTAFGAHF
jgi:hypothetical protein